MSLNSRIIKSELTLEKYPFKSLIELLINRLETDSEKECIIDCTLDRRWTKKQVLDSSLNFAYYLINDCGVEKGDIICFVTNNSDIHAIALIGVLASGATYTSLVFNSTELEIRIVVEKVKPTVLICFGENYKTMCDVFSDYSFVRKLLIIDEQSKDLIKNNSNLLTIEKIFKIGRQSAVKLPCTNILDDCATLVMSSGTTGQPKAIIRTNKNFMAILLAEQHSHLCPLTSNDIHLSHDFCHSTGQVILFLSIFAGAQLAIISFEENYDNAFQNINKYNITCAFIVPTQLNFLSKNYDKYDKIYLKSLRYVLTGTSNLSDSTYNWIIEKYNFESFIKSYGMSEIGGALMVYNSHSKCLQNKATVGKVCAGVEVKLINENGKSLGPNEFGELCFRGDRVSPGYLTNDEENAKLFTEDGFLKSGDYGYYDEKHFFYVIGRFKEIIKFEGLSVSPAELEHILLRHKEIENAAIIGIKNEDCDEIPLAFVTVVKGSTVTEKQIQDWFDSQVNHYKKLRGGVKIIDKFPLTPIKKINKTELKKMFPELTN